MRNARNPFLLPALAATLCCMVVPLFKLALLEWGAPDPETALFLEQYLAGRGVLESVFDPLRNDWGFYQGRELSYFFDRLDALWIGWSARHGILHFCSLWALLFTAGSVFRRSVGVNFEPREIGVKLGDARPLFCIIGKLRKLAADDEAFLQRACFGKDGFLLDKCNAKAVLNLHFASVKRIALRHNGEKRTLPNAVAADQPDAVARVDGEAGIIEKRKIAPRQHGVH